MKIIFADGSELSGLGMNGNTITSDKPLEPGMFGGGRLVKITFEYSEEECGIPGGMREEHGLMKLCACGPGGVIAPYIAVLNDYTEQELKLMKLEADVGYTAMMAGVQI